MTKETTRGSKSDKRGSLEKSVTQTLAIDHKNVFFKKMEKILLLLFFSMKETAFALCSIFLRETNIETTSFQIQPRWLLGKMTRNIAVFLVLFVFLAQFQNHQDRKRE